MMKLKTKQILKNHLKFRKRCAKLKQWAKKNPGLSDLPESRDYLQSVERLHRFLHPPE